MSAFVSRHVGLSITFANIELHLHNRPLLQRRCFRGCNAKQETRIEAPPGSVIGVIREEQTWFGVSPRFAVNDLDGKVGHRVRVWRKRMALY